MVRKVSSPKTSGQPPSPSTAAINASGIKTSRLKPSRRPPRASAMKSSMSGWLHDRAAIEETSVSTMLAAIARQTSMIASGPDGLAPPSVMARPFGRDGGKIQRGPAAAPQGRSGPMKIGQDGAGVGRHRSGDKAIEQDRAGASAGERPAARQKLEAGHRVIEHLRPSAAHEGRGLRGGHGRRHAPPCVLDARIARAPKPFPPDVLRDRIETLGTLRGASACRNTHIRETFQLLDA